MNQAKQNAQAIRTSGVHQLRQVALPPIDIAPNDPIVAYFLSSPGAVEIDKLQMDSPALQALKEANVKLAIPLVSQGELVGLLNLGPRLSENEAIGIYDTEAEALKAAQAACIYP